MSYSVTANSLEGIAIIGMAGRFPGAKNIEAFWQNLRDGVESIEFFSDEALLAKGIEASVLNDPNYIKAVAPLEEIELFDAAFFGFNPREAAMIDPQQRIFLECAWEALEHAGYDAHAYSGRIGTYAGVGWNSYLMFNIAPKRDFLESAVGYQTLIGNEKDFLTTRVSYQLNLKGPSFNLQTACSTSLVAVSVACQSLLSYQCDMALAGGITIYGLQSTGYRYHEGGILSPDGHCRVFDAKAKGTVPGSGAGIVVLKRLEEALADGDPIHAIIRGAAINNDGSTKVGYTAPSVEGQAEVIAEALALAGVEPETISYIEAHGTGTSLGDPIEIAALTQVFRASTDKKGFCAIGSVKSNLGHLDAAAGVAGLIKTVLALKHKQIPPSLHFEQPNPQIDFANSPFYVNSALREWKDNGMPRRAGVSSFGIGGTNAHVILEEGRKQDSRGKNQLFNQRPWQLLVLSAKTPSALETATVNLTEHLKEHPDLSLADVAYTLQVGRRAFDYRRLVVCHSIDEAIKKLIEPSLFHLSFTEGGEQPSTHSSPCFLFPGQGSQYVNMGRELYEMEATFREQVNRCCELLKPHLGLDLCTILYPLESQTVTQQLKQTAMSQPALFIVEYALAQLWMEWGVQPQAMIGHSIGEYVAACLAGVFSLEDALMLVAARGQLMQQLPKGAMLSVPLSEQEIQPFLGETLSLAAINGPSLCVVSGVTEAIEGLHSQLAERGLECRRLQTSHAFHSAMMDDILDAFEQRVRQVNLHAPQIPLISNVTGTWMTAEQATNPNYWVRHLRQTVRFASGLQQLGQKPGQIWLEVGPGRVLTTLAKQYLSNGTGPIILTSIRHPQDNQSDVAFLLNTLGQLWLAGVSLNWSEFYAYECRQRLPLPTYPFERQRYWIENREQVNFSLSSQLNEPTYQSDSSLKKPDIADWFYIPSWKRSLPPQWFKSQSEYWVVFVDDCGFGEKIVKGLEQEGQEVVVVRVGEEIGEITAEAQRRGEGREYKLSPGQRDDYQALFERLYTQGKFPRKIIYLWGITVKEQIKSALASLDILETLNFFSLLFLTQTLGEQYLTDAIEIEIVSNQMQAVTGEEIVSPEKALLLGPCKVIAQEYPNITCRSIDIVLPTPGSREEKKLINQLLAEFTHSIAEPIIAYRGDYRWVQAFEAVRFEETLNGKHLLRESGVYLITGGLGGLGLVVAEYLAQTVQAKLVLLGRSPFPAKEDWEDWLATRGEQDEIGRKIRKLQRMEVFGAEVLVLNADVTNLEQMQEAIAQISKRFGQIQGVIHAAGVAPGGMIQTKTPEMAASVLGPKVKGTLVLEQLLQDVELDFFLLFSSITSILGGVGMVDHCSANAFLDAFATAQNKELLTIAINWDGWQEVGQAANTVGSFAVEKIRTESLKQGISPQEGVDVFKRILSHPLPQVLVATQDLQRSIEREKAGIRPKYLEFVEKAALAKPIHARPEIETAYAAPRNGIEETIVEIWQEYLGIEKVGIDDNFFNLGGDSLLAVQIVSRLRQAFSIELHLHTLLSEAPTVAQLAAFIANKQLKPEQLAEIGQLLTELETLSPQQIQEELAREG